MRDYNMAVNRANNVERINKSEHVGSSAYAQIVHVEFAQSICRWRGVVFERGDDVEQNYHSLATRLHVLPR